MGIISIINAYSTDPDSNNLPCWGPSREHRKILEGDPGKSGGGTGENRDYSVMMGGLLREKTLIWSM